MRLLRTVIDIELLPDLHVALKFQVEASATAQRVSRLKSPSEVQGRSSDRLKQFAELFADFDCRNDQNLKISHKSPPDS